MERAICERCGARQPVDWASGDLCVACGAAVRHEVRCAWCAEWVPGGRFCRSCGCEVVSETLYGAARMLKNAGVDRFSIVARLRELDPEQVQNLSRIYESQLVVVLRRIEEARFCETFLLQKTHALRLEEELVPLLPMEKEQLTALASGPAGPFQDRPELLPEIARESPIQLTRALAAVALLRNGCTERKHLIAACDALQSKDQALALEAALALGNWRVRGLDRHFLYGLPYEGGVGLDARRLRDVACAVDPGSALAPWASAAFTLASFSDGVLPARCEEEDEKAGQWESFRNSLRDGLASTDPDLRFTCALALGAMEPIAVELDSEDGARRAAAVHFLARHKSPAIARFLEGGPDETRREVLEDLWPPLPDKLIEPVLHAAEEGDSRMRRQAARLLQSGLTPETVSRLIRIARAAGDSEVFDILLDAGSLPDRDSVFRSVVEAGLFQKLSEKLWRHIDFSDSLVQELAKSGDIRTLELLLGMADRQLREAPCPAESPEERSKVFAAGRFLACIAFGPWPAQFRTDAYGNLAYHGSSYGGFRWGDWIGPQAVSNLFGSPGEFLCSLADVLQNPELEQMRLRVIDDLADHWLELLQLFAECRTGVGALTAALLSRVKTDFSGGADRVAQLLIAVVPLYPAEGLPAILGLLGDRDTLSRPWKVTETLRDGYSSFGQSLGRIPEALEKAVETLLESMKVDDHATDRIRPAAAVLLAKIATDFPHARHRIARGIEPHLPNWTFFSGGGGELESLMRAVGVRIPNADEDESKGEPELPDSPSLLLQAERLALLDDQVLLPGNPLPTLADYCRFLSEMGASANPMETMARFGMNTEQYVQSVTAWGELISRRDDVAIRYSLLVAAKN